MREYRDSNVGMGMVPHYDSPEEKALEKAEAKLRTLRNLVKILIKERHRCYIPNDGDLVGWDEKISAAIK